MAKEYKTPLDIEEVVDREVVQNDEMMRQLFLLEMIPIAIIGLGIALKYFGKPFWIYAFVLGGIAASVLYVYFSYYMFTVKKYNKLEILLAVLCAIYFPLGVASVVWSSMSLANAQDIVKTALYVGIGFSFVSMFLFVLHIRNERASSFYRGLLARILILTAILLQFYAYG